jgi:DMSO/TMAO reductase YedYZ molybdopterin-dependent catalytic subunit
LGRRQTIAADDNAAMADDGVTLPELQLAARNHGMPLEALRYPVTPVGLHYLLIHYDIPEVDADTWRLRVDGDVQLPREFSLDELRALPAVELVATMECAGNGRARLEPRPISQPWLLEAVGTARWRGVSLESVLYRAGVRPGATHVLFTGLDHGVEGGSEQHYQRALPLAEASRDEVLLAYEMNGAPLPPQHGFPLRLVTPGWYGMTNVKWLDSITLLDKPFTGYQQSHAYRFRVDEDDEGTPVTRMQPRALMLPPGVPDFMTRERTVHEAPVVLEGRAWSGWAPIESVEVSVDGGASWDAATLDDVASQWAWRGWSFAWSPEPGRHVIACRATDARGTGQPLDPVWNVGGYSNTAVQQVVVNVV